ncbi:hypothetical protein N7478_000011 [Penicillium angulare]|uniref:uncharacterized protein n=1 Tax=Penicillium angulare TaxID=116970 RepID=UPI002541BA49|nr:uncharacterized protein N7478_000011 [Penicillium angulare]KAJ5290760.1 hypothetical protein N7478_000011 [Penicillium angulare]
MGPGRSPSITRSRGNGGDGGAIDRDIDFDEKVFGVPETSTQRMALYVHLQVLQLQARPETICEMIDPIQGRLMERLSAATTDGAGIIQISSDKNLASLTHDLRSLLYDGVAQYTLIYSKIDTPTPRSLSPAAFVLLSRDKGCYVDNVWIERGQTIWIQTEAKVTIGSMFLAIKPGAILQNEYLGDSERLYRTIVQKNSELICRACYAAYRSKTGLTGHFKRINHIGDHRGLQTAERHGVSASLTQFSSAFSRKFEFGWRLRLQASPETICQVTDQIQDRLRGHLRSPAASTRTEINRIDPDDDMNELTSCLRNLVDRNSNYQYAVISATKDTDTPHDLLRAVYILLSHGRSVEKLEMERGEAIWIQKSTKIAKDMMFLVIKPPAIRVDDCIPSLVELDEFYRTFCLGWQIPVEDIPEKAEVFYAESLLKNGASPSRSLMDS